VVDENATARAVAFFVRVEMAMFDLAARSVADPMEPVAVDDREALKE
jgi:hypothetical protein